MSITLHSPDETTEELLKQKELMRLLRVSRWWLTEREAEGMPHIRCGRFLRYPKAAVLAWLAAGDQPAANA